jgi:hypothetical protein
VRRSKKAAADPSGFSCDWIVPLAEPYLRGYTPHIHSDESLVGHYFLAPHSAPFGRSTRKPSPGRAAVAASAGFFLGYLNSSEGSSPLKCSPPECLVFCFVQPVRSRFHRRVVNQPESLMRRTAEYIRWLTHHLPRFEFFADDEMTLVRHVPIAGWPESRIAHFSRNFFIETLAWLVRTALVRRLPEELKAASRTSAGKASRKPQARRSIK